MNHIPVKIPCKPHIKAFLEFHFGVDYVLSTGDFLGTILFHLLKKESKHYRSKKSCTMKKYVDFFTVLVPEDHFFCRNVQCVEAITSVHFNNLVDTLISFMFKKSIDNRMKSPPRYRKDAILEWMDENGINEEHLTEDAFIKAYQRYRQQAKELRMG